MDRQRAVLRHRGGESVHALGCSATMSHKKERLASVIRELIAPILLHCPKECGVVTITEVEISDDKQFATLYISALNEPNLAIGYLESRLPTLQQKLGELQKARVPRLRFKLDPRTERGSRIDELLREA